MAFQTINGLFFVRTL